MGNHFQTLPQLFLYLHLAPLQKNRWGRGRGLGSRLVFPSPTLIPTNLQAPNTGLEPLQIPLPSSMTQAVVTPASQGDTQSQEPTWPSMSTTCLGTQWPTWLWPMAAPSHPMGRTWCTKRCGPPTGQGWLDLWPGLGHHGIPPNPYSSPQGRSTLEHPEFQGAACPQPPLSPPSCTVLCL